MSTFRLEEIGRVKFLGNFPRKHYHFERSEEPTLREAIKRLCSKEKGYMAVVGQGGTGKSTLVAKILQTEDYLAKECPSIETVIWLNMMKLSSKKLDKSGFYLTLANLTGVKIRKPEAQNDKPLDEQLREALISRRSKPASIMLVLDDVFSDEILPLLARFQSIIRCIAITRFGATLGMHSNSSNYVPIVVNVQPMNDLYCFNMMKEVLPEELLPEDKLTQLAKHAVGLPLVARLICGHFIGCNDAKTAGTKFDELNEKLAPGKNARTVSMVRRVQDTVSRLLELHFEKNDELFVKFAAFLVFEEETGIDAEDLSYLWNMDVADATSYCEKEFCAKAIVQAVNFDDSNKEGTSDHFQMTAEDEAPSVIDYAEDGPISLTKKHSYAVNSLIYQAAADLQKKLKDKEAIQLGPIIKEAGRRHPKAWLGENILHLASRLKRTALLRSIINRADVDSLLSLCAEENGDKVTPVKYLCSASVGEWLIDSAPPLLIKATLPLMEKLSATPLTDKLLELIIASDGNVDRLLLLACDIGYSFLIAKIIFKGRANVNARKRRWPYYNCLMLAARRGYDVIVKMLLDHGADISMKDGHGRTALMLAVDMGRDIVVSLLLEKGADLVEDGNVMPALMLALEKHREEIAKLLLMKGAEQNISEDMSVRALILAARSCKEPVVVKFLLEKGADPNAKDVLNRTAVMQATLNGLKDNVRLLLDYGALPDVKDKERQTALMFAAMLGHDEICRMLIESNANVNAKDRLERTPIIFAAWKGHDAVVKLLLENGADANCKDSMARTPLILAAETGKETTVDVLLEQGADITAKDKVYNKTPLMVAAEHGHWTVVRQLLEHGASANESENFNRRSALMLAAERGHAAIVELLLQRGVDPNVANAFNMTPLMFAAEAGHESSIKLLLDKGANPRAKDNYNRTALTLAKGREDIVKLLIPVS